MKSQYNKTITACFVGYIVQAIVNNFTPLLFLFFQKIFIIFHIFLTKDWQDTIIWVCRKTRFFIYLFNLILLRRTYYG